MPIADIHVLSRYTPADKPSQVLKRPFLTTVHIP